VKKSQQSFDLFPISSAGENSLIFSHVIRRKRFSTASIFSHFFRRRRFSTVLFQSHSISSGGKNSDLFDSIPFLQEEEEIQQRFFEANGYLQEEEENPAEL
jgi:hypothetical protein